MRRLIVVMLVLLGVGLSAQQPSSVPEIPFDAEAPLKLPPDLYFGEVAGVAVNSRGHVFVYTRTGSAGHVVGPRAAQLFEFGPDGSFIREIGKNLYAMAWAHSVRIDADDNIWIVDNGSDMDVKLSPEGRVLLVLGRRRESVAALHPRPPDPPGSPPRPARPGIFNEPTDIAFDPAGNIYISDGYRNSRVAKFDKDGHWVASWGEPGSEPGQFRLPHGIAADADGNVYVADRSNSRIQVLDSDGNFLRQITLSVPPPVGYVANIPDFGRRPDGTYTSLWPNTLCITPPPNQVIYSHDMFPGRIYKMSLEGEVLGYFGTTGRKLGQFGWIHALGCVSENELWVGELLNWRAQKLTLHPEQQATTSSSGR